ncbi:MAG TPA: response regulator [Methylomirabilota bacterium]|nr:response regulator [Methylomirabilota bacterium]
MPNEDRVAAKILVVDDEPSNVRLLERLLATAGYQHIVATTDARQVLGLFRSVKPDLVLLDLMMPHLDGIAVLGQLTAEIPAGEYLPVIVLTADATLEARHRALAAGAKDFVTKPFEQTEVLLRIGNLLDTRRLYLALEAHNRTLEQTVRERTERLVQSEKVATMGSLLAGVAHEMNNPLAVVTGQTQLLRESATDPDVVRRAEKIDAAAVRCVRIVRNFLALARQRPPERSDVWLQQIVAGAIELLAYELRTDTVEIVVDFDRDIPRLSADPNQLHQVLVNLIANAHQALRRRPQPRTITVAVRHDAARARVRVEVTDTGPGIPPEIQARIFEPFFTTKPPGEGTGLGLSLCRGIIEEHGGTLEVESEPGRGSTFTIDLPIVATPLATPAKEVSETLPPVGRKRLLVIDDEAEVAAVMAEALEREGHTVDVAPNGAVALDMVAGAAYDLILTDTKMPVLDGEGFYEELRRRFPALGGRIIFLTGDVLSQEKRAFLDRTGAPVLMKPCDLAEVRRLVHRVLAGS